MDVITAFLHGRVEEEVYMKIPPRMYIKGGAEGKVLRLKGALYGLKQSSHVWQETFKKIMISEGFKQCVMDTCIYMRGEGDSRIILGIHVDDQVITGPNAMVVKTFKEDMGKKFKVKDLGPLTHILGVGVKRDRLRKLLTLGQSGFLRGVLER